MVTGGADGLGRWESAHGASVLAPGVHYPANGNALYVFAPPEKNRHALFDGRASQVVIDRRQRVPIARGDLKVGCIVRGQAMLAAEGLGPVEHVCRRRLVQFDREAIEVRNECLGEFQSQPLSPLAHEKRIQNFMPPERRNDHRVARDNSL